MLRDPRFALHSATVDKNVAEGDARITARAVLADDTETLGRFREAFEAHTGYPPPPGPFPLFRADIYELSMLRPAGDHLNIDWWRVGGKVVRVERY